MQCDAGVGGLALRGLSVSLSLSLCVYVLALKYGKYYIHPLTKLSRAL